MWHTAWVGLGAILIGFFLAGLFIVSLVGWSIGVFIIIYLVVGFIAGIGLFSYALGSRIGRLIWKNKSVSWLHIAIGSLLLTILLLIPLVGPLVILTLVLLGTGNLTILLWRARLRKQND